MARNKRNMRNKAVAQPKQQVDKADSTTPATSRLRQGFISTKAMYNIQRLVDRLMPWELKYPYCLDTFETMKQDADVFGALYLNYVMIEKQFEKPTFSFNPDNPKSKEAAEFVEWCFNNMDGQTLLQAIKNIETFKEKGFSLAEKGYTRIVSGKYSKPENIKSLRTDGQVKPMRKFSELANIPQMTLSRDNPFIYVDGSRKIKEVRQRSMSFQNSPSVDATMVPIAPELTKSSVKIPRAKFMLFGDNATDSTPFGNPIFRSIYKAWREKVLIEDYQAVGITKDLGGIVKIKMPQEILDKAARDANSDEGLYVQQLMADAANMHAGDQSFITLPSDTMEGGNIPAFDMTLQGIEGGGKQFELSTVIKDYRRVIYDAFGAGNVLLGEGGGSYALMEGKNTLHAHYVKRDAREIADEINKDAIPQLLSLNGVLLDSEDIPKIVPNEIEDLSADEASKLVQRAKAVNGLVQTKDNIIAWHKMLGFDTTHMENMTREELTELMEGDTGQSRASDGMKGGLNSSTSDISRTDATVSNNESA